MKGTPIRATLGFTLLCVSVFLLPPPAATAATDTSFLAFTSDPEDWVGQGDSRTFTSADGRLYQYMADASTFGTLFDGYDGISRASLHLRAPSGQLLVPGAYENATRFQVGDPSLPQLDFSYDHRGCNIITGRFDVLESTYGPYNYIQKFHATFEQHCEGSTAATYGEVQVVNPPPPPTQQLQLSVDPVGTVDKWGIATIGGTVTCSLPVSYPDITTVMGTITQTTRNGTVSGDIATFAMSCGPGSDPWSYTVYGFGVGRARVTVTARAPEPNYPGEHSPAVTISAETRLHR
jgi:hypothetical protein